MTPEQFVGHVPGIAEALARCADTDTVHDVIQKLNDPNVKLWGDERALILTRALPDGILHFWIATGELDAVKELSNRIVEWARESGYTRATLIGRRGWIRALNGDGWAETAVAMQRKI